MQLFVSYGRRDAGVLEGLVTDLERSGNELWMDRDISGGQRWWDELLAHIRKCDALLFALSPESVASRACRAELAYAVDLGKPIVPVMVRETNVDLAPDPIGLTQIVDYRERNSDSSIELVMSLAKVPPAPPLPDPLPSPPPAAITDLGPIREALSAESMSEEEQRSILEDLGRRRDELDQVGTIRALLGKLRRRSDVLVSIAQGIDTLLSSLPLADSAEDQARSPRPMSQRSPDSIDRLRALVTHVRAGRFTPVIGSGVNDPIIGSSRRLALEWSQTFEFPMAEHQRGALPDVAQFIAVMTDVETLRSSLGDYIRSQLIQRYPEVAKAEVSDLGEAMRIAWRTKRTAEDPYLVLAELPCPIYITANPWSLLSDALREAGRDPVTEVCRWRPDVYEWPSSVFEVGSDYTPSVERPLVFHVFGALTTPESLVLTQDDFDEFLIAVAENRSIIPSAVQRVLASSAIMLLGFELEERDVRVLTRSLIGQEGSQKLKRYRHVAAQLEYTDTVTSPARAKRYMERYFSTFHQPSIDLFWGTVEEFSADLAELWRAER